MNRFFQALLHAFHGFGWAWSHELHIKYHSIAAGVVMALLAWLNAPLWHWVVILLCVGMVFGFELVNSSIEALANRVTSEEDAAIKRVKDMAAAAVLVASLISVVVGVLLLGPPVYAYFLT